MRVCVIVSLLIVAACAREPVTPAHAVEREHLTMGSLLKVSAWTTDDAGTLETFEHLFREFDRLDAMLTTWKNDSDVSRINAAAGTEPVKVSRETIDVLTIAHEISAETGGKFDITFGALTDIWKFDHDQDNTVPDRAAIEARLPLIDYEEVVTDRSAGTAFIRKPGMRIHLGGIGKGYAVDRGVAMMKERGLRDFSIQFGGDLYVAGSNGGKPWKLGIADPRGEHDAFAMVEMSDGTFSTSGDYERTFLKDGVRYHHILDPDRGEPARGCRSVTLVTNRAVIADALAKGVFILGPADGMALIEKLPDVEGVIVGADNRVLVSSGLKGRVQLIKMPTNEP
jgi:thiamine biosynthesis lipoprotein